MRSQSIVLLFGIFLLLGYSTTCEAEGSGRGTTHDEVKRIINMDISHADPATVPDGEYIGEFPFTQRYMYRVKVEVKSGRIVGIEVLENGTENEHAEKGLGVIPYMLEKQSPDVDAVSGATVTSKSLMKCVEEALKRGREINK